MDPGPGGVVNAPGTAEDAAGLPRFNPYPAYKDSGVEWLGKIPAHWGTAPLFTVAREREVPNKRGEETNVLSLSYGRIVRRDVSDSFGLMPESFDTYQIVVKDNLVLRLTDLQNDKRSLRVGLVPERGIITSAYVALDVLARLNTRYFFYLLHAYDVTKVFYALGGGVRQTMKFDDLKWMPMLVPKESEQQAVAVFLDRETAKIDALVVKNERLIDLLREKRIALISRIVTRGLTPAAARPIGLPTNLPPRLSGLDWLCGTPAHWEPISVRHCARRIQTGSTPPTSEMRYYEDGTIPWYGPSSFDEHIAVSNPVKLLNASAINEGAARMFAPEATMIVTIGATLGKVSSLSQSGSCNQQITCIEFDKRRVHPRFATYQLKSFEGSLRAIAPSATLPILDQREIAGLPPLPEQLTLSAYLDEETAKLDTLVTKVEAAIERLREYRVALITTAVTGKIDLQEGAA
jgi:type I restriction enzyme, S subunit